MVVILGAYILLAHSVSYWPFSNATVQKTQEINHNPATKDEQAAADRHKNDFTDSQNRKANNSNKSSDSPSDNQQSTTNDKTPPPTKTANVFVSFAGQEGSQINVNAYTDYYGDGTCTITFSQKNAQTLAKQAPAYADATTTICTNPEIDRSEFPSAGKWAVTVTYESKDGVAKGASSPQIIDIK